MNVQEMEFSDILVFTSECMKIHETWNVPVGCKVVGSFYQEGHDPFLVHSFEEIRTDGFSLELWAAFNDYWATTSYGFSGESFQISLRIEFGPEAYKKLTRFERPSVV